jgi:putative hydrolase of the HAD superfamily
MVPPSDASDCGPSRHTGPVGHIGALRGDSPANGASSTIGAVADPDEADRSIFDPPAGPQVRVSRPAGAGPIRGVITDWGGVMTNPIIETVTAWLAADGIDVDSYKNLMRAWVSQAYDGGPDRNPIRALERGECSEAEFEGQLARQLTRRDGAPVVAAGLLTRMFAATAFDEAMHEVMRAARRAGLRTGLLSNSWGAIYPRHLFPDLFDAVVISAEVGMRKPEERIFRLAAEILGLEPAECVFIDDIRDNVAAAQAVGLVGVHHRTATQTKEQLADLLGVAL